MRISFTFLLLFTLGCSGAVPVATDVTPTVPRSDLRVHFFDVGQGDASLIVTPDGRAILIDAGPPDAATNLLWELQRLGVTHLSLVIMSHAHADHIGSFDDILREVPVARFVDPGFPHPSQMYANLLEQLATEETQSYTLHAGQWIHVEEDVDLFVLAPSETFIEGSRSDVNANSLVLLLQYGEVRFLFVGDAEVETELQLIREGWLSDIDVLKVAHHGSDYATIQSFLDLTAPEYAVISCGRDNSYGHPAPDTLQRLLDVGANVARTDISGTIVVSTDGETVSVSPSGTTTSDLWRSLHAAADSLLARWP